jgi:hypothetical protein
MKTNSKNTKIIEQLIRNEWDSLESHLPYMYGKVPKPETNKFHKQCVKDYSEQIKLLSELL